jgi:hypothetical protein
MGKAGLITSTIFVTGFLVGLGFSCYHQGLNQDARGAMDDMITNNYLIESAVAYRNSSSSLDGAANYMGDLFIKDNEVFVIENPDNGRVLENLDDALKYILPLKDSQQYVNEIVELNKELLLLEEVKEDALDYKQAEIDIRLLANDLESISYEREPNVDGIYARRESYNNRVYGCGFGIGGACIGVIACGIWMGFQAYEVSGDLSRERRNYKRTRNKI